MPGVFNPDGKKVILSLSGGGMRGLLSLAMLAEWERQSGRPIYEQVDLIAGTSTGAVMAAGFAVGMSAERMLREIYRDALPRAFGRRGPFLWLRFLLSGARHIYRLAPFARILKPYVANLRVGDIQAPILLLTTTDTRTGNTYYIVSRGPGRARFAHWPLAGAVAASAAAPVFFPPVRGNLIDGGVGIHYNPCLAAAIEAMEYLGAGGRLCRWRGHPDRPRQRLYAAPVCRWAGGPFQPAGLGLFRLPHRLFPGQPAAGEHDAPPLWRAAGFPLLQSALHAREPGGQSGHRDGGAGRRRRRSAWIAPRRRNWTCWRRPGGRTRGASIGGGPAPCPGIRAAANHRKSRS